MQQLRILFLFAALLSTEGVLANLQVYPTRVVLDDKARVSQLTLTHTGSGPMTYEVVPVFYEQDSKGRMKAIDGKAAVQAQFSAAPLVRYSPRVFTLKTGETQTLKIRAQPSATLSDGIYRIHLRVQPTGDVKAAAPKSAPKNPKSGGTSLELTALLSIAVPIYFSHGSITRNLEMLNPSVSTDGKLLSFELKQSGNGFLFGDIFVSSRTEKSQDSAKELGRLLSMASYASQRRIEIPLDPPFKKTGGPDEQLRIEVRQSPDEGGAMIFESEIPSAKL